MQLQHRLGYETSECQRHVDMHAVVSPNTSQRRDTARQAYSKGVEAYSYFVTRLKCTQDSGSGYDSFRENKTEG